MTSSPYVLYKKWLLLRVISTRRCTPAGFKLTKLFGIDDFSAAKDFGKVFIIIIYCFYNYYIFKGGSFLTFNGFVSTFYIKTNFLKYYGLCHAIPLEWINLLKDESAPKTCSINNSKKTNL